MALHPPAAQPRPRRAVRAARRADHPRRGAHVRHGRAVPGVRRSTRRSARSTSRSTPTCCSRTARRQDGQILEEGITEAGVDGELHRRRHELRHPRRADDAVLHLLFDVRLPAGRRPHLGRRPTPAPAASCSAPPPAARRCSARACSTRTATASCWPRRCRRARPTTRRSRTRWRRSCETASQRMYGPEPEDVFYYLTLYNENYAMPPMPDGVDRGRHRRAACTAGPTRPTAPTQRATILFSGSAHGAARAGRSRAGRALRRRRRAVVGHVATRRCARRRWPPSAGTGCTRPGAGAHAARHRAARRRRGPDRRGHRLHEGRARPDRPLRARPAVRPARHRRLRPLRHPRGAAPPLRGRRRPRRRRRARRPAPRPARSSPRPSPTRSTATTSTPTRSNRSSPDAPFDTHRRAIASTWRSSVPQQPPST